MMSVTKVSACDPIILQILIFGSLRERYRWRRVCRRWVELLSRGTSAFRELSLIGAVRSQESQEQALKYFVENAQSQPRIVSLKLPYGITSVLAQEISHTWPNIQSLTISSIFIRDLEPFGRLKWLKGDLSYGPEGPYGAHRHEALARYHGILGRLKGFDCPAYILHDLVRQKPLLCGTRSLHIVRRRRGLPTVDYHDISRYKFILAKSVRQLNVQFPQYGSMVHFEQLRSLRLHLDMPGLHIRELHEAFEAACLHRLESLVVLGHPAKQWVVPEVLAPLTGLKRLMLPGFWHMTHDNIVHIPKEAPISKLGLCVDPDCLRDVIVHKGYLITELVLKRSCTEAGVAIGCITLDQVVGVLSALPLLKSLKFHEQKGIGDEVFHQLWNRIPNLHFIGLKETQCTAEGLAWFVEKRIEQITRHGQHQLPVIYVDLDVDWSLTSAAQRFAGRVENYEPFVSISSSFTLAWPLDVFEL